MTTDGGDRFLGAPRFDVVLRGYDRRQVDEHLARLQRVITRLQADLEGARRLQAPPPPPVTPGRGFPGQGGRPQPRPAAQRPPAPAPGPDVVGGFTDRMQSILRAAEEEAAEIRRQARASTQGDDQLRAQVAHLAGERDAVLAELDRMRGQVADLTGGTADPQRTSAPPWDEKPAAAGEGTGTEPAAVAPAAEAAAVATQHESEQTAGTSAAEQTVGTPAAEHPGPTAAAAAAHQSRTALPRTPSPLTPSPDAASVAPAPEQHSGDHPVAPRPGALPAALIAGSPGGESTPGSQPTASAPAGSLPAERPVAAMPPPYSLGLPSRAPAPASRPAPRPRPSPQPRTGGQPVVGGTGGMPSPGPVPTPLSQLPSVQPPQMPAAAEAGPPVGHHAADPSGVPQRIAGHGFRPFGDHRADAAENAPGALFRPRPGPSVPPRSRADDVERTVALQPVRPAAPASADEAAGSSATEPQAPAGSVEDTARAEAVMPGERAESDTSDAEETLATSAVRAAAEPQPDGADRGTPAAAKPDDHVPSGTPHGGNGSNNGASRPTGAFRSS